MVSRPHDLRVVGFMGQRMGLSELDVRVLGDLYGCLGNVTATDSNARLSEALRKVSGGKDASNQQVLSGSGFHGECQDRNSSGFFDDLGNTMPCSGAKLHCSHASLGGSIRSACPRTCHECVPTMW